MRALLHLALVLALCTALLGEWRDPMFLHELARNGGLLLALGGLIALAASGPAALGRAWKAHLQGDDAPALALPARLVRDLGLALALLAVADPLLQLAQGEVPPPAVIGGAISDALLFGFLGLALGELWLGRAAGRTRSAGLAPLAFLMLPALVLFLAYTEA